MDEQYCIYLRKSRADKDAEAHGEGETLARHEAMLLTLANKMNLEIKEIYREIVSGETIAARPVMQQLLSEVEQGLWDGVLVVEVERLARGNTKDQGIVSEAFKYGDCKIITPIKTYDPDNEFDEEYFEFGLFMSRREYKTINRRIQRGRLASLQEGKYIAGTAPFGYTKVKIQNDKGWTLEINEDEVKTVKLIFSLYTQGELQDDGSYKRLGMYLIAKKLDSIGYKTRSGKSWIPSTIKAIITNQTYIGKVIWRRRPVNKNMNNGIVSESRNRNHEYVSYDGVHPAIITEEEYNLAQRILSTRGNAPIVSNTILKNPLSGLVVCGKCGTLMTRTYSNTKEGYYILKCPNRDCDNISSAIYLIEREILKGLSEWMESYSLKWDDDNHKEPDSLSMAKGLLEKSESELSKLETQLNNTYALLEQGVYDLELFKKRNASITNDIAIYKTTIEQLQNNYNIALEREKIKNTFIPNVKNILEVYDTLDSPAAKNNMLKEIIDHITYLKTIKADRNSKENTPFYLDIVPKFHTK